MVTGRAEQDRIGIYAPETLRMIRIFAGIGTIGLSEILIRTTQYVTRSVRRGSRA